LSQLPGGVNTLPERFIAANVQQHKLPTTMKDIVDLIGRIFISFIFLYEAYDSIAYFQDTLHKMQYFHLTWEPKLLLVGAIFLLIVGGLMVLLGYRASLGATLLLLYWIPVTFIVHSFWLYPHHEINLPSDMILTTDLRRLQSILFMKNIAITGGLLVVLVNGSQRFSIRKLFATTRVPD
jgi:putative oxidoreductase